MRAASHLIGKHVRSGAVKVPRALAVLEVDSYLEADTPRAGAMAGVGAATAEQLRLLVEGASDYAIFMLSPAGVILTWNSGAERAKGYTAAEVVGRHFSLFYTAAAVAAGHPAHELQVATSEGRYTEEGWRVRKDSSRFWAAVTITALRGEAGELRGFAKITRDLTERREAQSEAARLHRDREEILETLAEGVILYAVDEQGRFSVKVANTAACVLLDADVRALQVMPLGQGTRHAYGSDGHPIQRKDLPFAVTGRTGQPVDDFVWGLIDRDGHFRWLSSNSRPVRDAAGILNGVVFSLIDITERHNASRALEAAHGRFAALVAHSSDVICILDADAVVLYASPAYVDVYGEELGDRIGKPLTERIHPADASSFLNMLKKLLGSPNLVLTVDYRIVHLDGSVRHLEVTAANHVNDDAIAGFVTNSRDVTDRVETASRLAHETMHDALTGLANRALLLDRLSHALARAERTQQTCALLFIDLDHFKTINDSLGHAAGDQLLIAIADRLRTAIRPGDTVARLGGDEFVILAEDVVEGDSAHVIAERVRRAVSEPIELGKQQVSVDCSIGISLSDGSRPEALLQQADTALYRAKDRGRGRWETYDQAMRIGAQRRLDTEALLRDSVGTDDVVVHYQPIVSLPHGIIVGSEALVRIVDAYGRVTPPDEFVPVAEDTGLIVPLGLQVLRAACRQQASWTKRGDLFRRVSVNLSGRQLHTAGLLNDVSDALSAAGIPATALCLELTESTLIGADASTRKTVDALADLGIAIALDDFGTGMSSLSHLRRFPISIIKIDRSFVAGLERNHHDLELVKAVIGLARALDFTTIAEGVESPTQAAVLADLGCTHAQGYLYGRPEPA